MTEREFEQRLRAFYRTEADAGGRVPGELRESVLGIPDDVLDRAALFGPRRRVVLLAAAMLTAVLVGGAIALGSGLLRPPWQSVDRVTPLVFSHSWLTGEAIPLACDQTLPDGLLLSVEPQEGQVNSSAGPWLYVYDDGQLVRRLRDEDSDPVSASWSQRRLSPEGVQSLVATVEGSGLRDCRGALGMPPDWELMVKAKTGDGVVAVSLGSGGLRAITPAELAAAAELWDRFSGLRLGVPSSEWIEPDWEPYVADRWEILISPIQGDAGDPHQDGPWADLVLPDGSTFVTFGSSIRGPGAEPVEYRCRVVGRDGAQAMTAFLGEPAALDPVTIEGTWQFHDHDRGEGVDVRISPLLRQESGCAEDAAPPSDAPSADWIDDLHVCDYVLETALIWYRPEEHTNFGGGWAACSYPNGAWVFASRHPISSAEALELIEDQFGVGGFTTDEIAGRTVYFNACAAGCLPAVAISAEPHFVIVVPGEYLGSTLRELAEALIQRLDDRIEPR